MEDDMQFPQDLKYSEHDEWVRVEAEIGSIGVSDYAQDQLSDVVYVEITADVGDTIAKGDMFGLIESVKAAADVYMPLSGTLTEINEALIDTPELVNSDPYGEAWMVKFELSNPEELNELMDSAAYEKYVQERSA
jgi:glycine cleavage system H protein